MEKHDYREFVGNWLCIQTLGEGAYGEVKLLMHRTSRETIAVKIVDLKKKRDAEECVHKEIKIHSWLDHKHIIKLYGSRREDDRFMEYIYLEYAAGGELFNRIEPDVGMDSADAQRFMHQLLLGLEYLHHKGIAHRDIKPENLLLDAYSNLKISDFGMATIFRLKGRERLLEKRCGTLPYVAPEVLQKPYYAQAADIWSSGIVLITMLAGELPWDEPTLDCPEFVLWTSDDYLLSTPWSKLDNSVLSLVRKMLAPEPYNRPTIEQIQRHPWMMTKFVPADDDDSSTEGSTKLRKYSSSLYSVRSDYEATPIVALSQPASICYSRVDPENLSELLKARCKKGSFSQPTYNDDFFISSQMPCTKIEFEYLIQRMTRIFVKTDCDKTVEILRSILDRLHYTWHMDSTGFTISSVDSRKTPLVFKANIFNMDGKMLLDFRLSRGCGLEFKRRFIQLKNCLSDIILVNTECDIALGNSK